MRELPISIHALVKRATILYITVNKNTTNFNPRPRKEGDVLPKHSNTTGDGISIHALVKRATSKRQGLPMHL